MIAVYENQNKRQQSKSVKQILHRLTVANSVSSTYVNEKHLAYCYGTKSLIGLDSLDCYIVRFTSSVNCFVKAVKTLTEDMQCTGITLTAQEVSKLKEDNAEIQV